MIDLLSNLRWFATLGCGLMCGVFFAFSTSVIGGLARLEPKMGIAAMQSINRVIVNPLFLLLFLGTGLLCGVLAVLAWQAEAWRWLFGALAYLLGAVLVTVVVNVPLNNALEALSPDDPDGAARWLAFVQTWTPWNHVRAAASLLAVVLLLGQW